MGGGRPFGLSITKGTRTVAQSRGGAVQVRFTGVSLDDYAESLRQIARKGQNVQPAFAAWGEYLVNEHIPGQFAALGTPKRWARLSKAYAEWKQRHFPGRPLLVLTGNMKGSFSWKAGPRSLQIKNTAKRKGKAYWHYHQFGTSRMPARPVLQVRKEDRERLKEIALSYLITQTSGAGL
jgi:phage gpG-like protein